MCRFFLSTRPTIAGVVEPPVWTSATSLRGAFGPRNMSVGTRNSSGSLWTSRTETRLETGETQASPMKSGPHQSESTKLQPCAPFWPGLTSLRRLQEYFALRQHLDCTCRPSSPEGVDESIRKSDRSKPRRSGCVDSEVKTRSTPGLSARLEPPKPGSGLNRLE